MGAAPPVKEAPGSPVPVASFQASGSHQGRCAGDRQRRVSRPVLPASGPWTEWMDQGHSTGARRSGQAQGLPG